MIEPMTILITDNQGIIDIDLSHIELVLNRILKTLGNEGCEISITFVDDARITDINREYLGRNHPTNVISFSMNEGEFAEVNPAVLGDIILSTETAFRDAKSENLSPEDEIDYLLIHGVLHLLGYDHELPEDAEKMKKREKEIFFALKGYHIE